VRRDEVPGVGSIGGMSPEYAGETLQAGARYIGAISALPRFCKDAS